MKKRFLCLANSRKYTNRCIAGIELADKTRPGFKYDLVESEKGPRWIRPVSGQGHGEVAAALVEHIHLLDIVEIDGCVAHPQGFQTENVLFNGCPPSWVDRIRPDPALLEKLLTRNEPLLFGTAARCIAKEVCASLSYSLVLIHPQHVHFHHETSFSGKPQVRCGFLYQNIGYDLPVTDIAFLQRHSTDLSQLDNHDDLFFAVSLGVEFEGFHYKLIAGIIECNGIS